MPTAITLTSIAATPTLNAVITMDAAVAAMTFPNTGRELLIVKNGSAGAITVTITSVAEPRTGRTGTIAKVLTAGQDGIFGPFPPIGFNDSSGNVAVGFSGTDAALKVAAVRPA